jgi:hypothetical protein
MSRDINAFLGAFQLDELLRAHTAVVLTALPDHVLEDLTDDPRFMLADYDPTPGLMAHILVRAPGKSASRSVVLKRTLRHRPREFALYVIAHELAHAHLRNSGRFPGEDPERAADALAAEWGFPRP